jgi:hypothetical protein
MQLAIDYQSLTGIVVIQLIQYIAYNMVSLILATYGCCIGRINTHSMSENDGKVKLDDLNVVCVYLWPKSIQEENGMLSCTLQIELNNKDNTPNNCISKMIARIIAHSTFDAHTIKISNSMYRMLWITVCTCQMVQLVKIMQ